MNWKRSKVKVRDVRILINKGAEKKLKKLKIVGEKRKEEKKYKHIFH
jgi:hypothetical protein